MRSTAVTVDEYLAGLPPARAELVRQARGLVNENIPPGYQETMNWGMISWQIPLATISDTYNKQPY